MNMGTLEILQNSILIAAHPDDEILWFSSILDKVDKIIICFLECESMPNWTIGRKKSLTEHPIESTSCLDIDESEVFSDANFRDPIVTKNGIEITDKKKSDRKYIENFYKLKKELKTKLIDYDNVFTHNPWGEYGNEEHIQIYRVINNLKEELGFTLWFPNYSSNKSYKLMLKHIFNANSEYVTLKTNKILSDHIKRIYQKNGCWTWYDDWKWFDEESFIKDNQPENGVCKYGHMFPLNLINVKISNGLEKKPDRKHRLFRLFASKRTGSQYT
jgi:hypothetical protein